MQGSKDRKNCQASMATGATNWVQGTNPMVGANTLRRVDNFVKALSFELTKNELDLSNEPYVTKATLAMVNESFIAPR